MTTIVDDYSPVTQGDVGALFAPVFADKNGPYDLTNATITSVFQLENDPAIARNGTGTWHIDVAAEGKAHFSYSADDVGTPGLWFHWITVTRGGLPVHFDDGTGRPKLLEITPAPVVPV